MQYVGVLILLISTSDAYMIMRECWHNDPLHRPTFSELVEAFDRLLTMAKESNYLEMGDNCGYSPITTGKICI